MGRNARQGTALAPLDDTQPVVAAFVERQEAVRQEYDVRQMAASRLATFGPLMEAVGRIKTAEFYRTVSDSLIAQTFAEVRRTKAYKDMPYLNADGNPEYVRDLEHFCQVFLGKGYDRCVQLADALHTLGPDLYDRAQAIGFKSKDYRALKALPADDQEAVRAALEEGDKDQALTVLSQLVARHQHARSIAERDRDQAQAAHETVKADYKAASDLLGAKEVEIRKLQGGDIPVPKLPEQLADWGTAAHGLIGTARKDLAEIGLMIDRATKVGFPDDPDAQAEYRAALGLVNEALDAGLYSIIATTQELQRRLNIGVSMRMWTDEELGGAA